MARPGITREQVRDAIVALRAQGREPTLRNERPQIGRGSYCTLLRHLDVLLPNRRRQRRAKPPKQWVRMQCDAAFRALWASAYRQAAQELAARRSDMDAAVARTLQSLAASRAAMQRVHEQVQGLAHRVWRLEARLSQMARERPQPANSDEADVQTAAADVGSTGANGVSWPWPSPRSPRRRVGPRREATAAEPMGVSAAMPDIEADVSA